LPLRLHVDQDALDFITRFFEFKDDTAPPSAGKGDGVFLQRVEVDTVQIRLDYKPKKVDYAGLRSGHTTEFMNFVILDEANIVLRHAILYGIPGFDKLHDSLSAIWTPDVIKNQIPNILAGLAGVRSLVNVGSGMKDLFVVPIQEYKKDGRIIRSLQKGAFAFGRNTTIEMARLGAKLAVGTQAALEGIEGLVAPQDPSAGSSSDNGWEDLDPDEERRAISHYANQPLGVRAGFRGAARHLERDLLTARDAIMAIPTEVMESGSATGAAKALLRRAPIVIIRPALGTTKAVGNALFGLSNAADPDSRRKIEDVSPFVLHHFILTY
jgi:autophagy-related protein 2